MIEKVETTKDEKYGGDNNGNNGNGGGNGGGGSGGDTNMCLRTDNYKYEIEKENWNEQLQLLETEHDVNLKKCLRSAREDIIKLITEGRDVKKKYSGEYKKLKDEYDCKVKNNKTDLGNIPSSQKTELECMLKELQEKIFNLGQCKSKFNCIDLETAPVHSTDAGRPRCPTYKFETFVSCDMSAYTVLTSKTEIKLTCKKDEVKYLKPLQVLKYELEKSNRYNEAINNEYTQLKESQKNITDLFKQVDDYLKKIESLSAEEKCKKWVYVLLIEKLLIDICHLLLTPDLFSSNMDAKIKEVEKAKKDLCYRTYNKDKTEALLKFATENYETLKKNLETDALDRLSDV